MAGRIAGITIEIDGNTTKLSKALQGVNKDIKTTQSSLKDINKLLKFDGGNVTLLKQKQEQLTTAIDKTKQKLQQEKEALRQLKEGDQTPEVKAQMEALERQIADDEQKLKQLTQESKNFGSVAKQQFKAAGDAIKACGDKIKSVGDKMTSIGRNLSLKVTAPLALIGKQAVTSFAEVDKTMQLTNKTMGNTTEEAKLLSDAMKEAAANSTFGMTDAATASLNFARAGLSAEEAAASLAPAMNLAAGEGGNLDTVSAGLVATINGFGDSFDSAEHYADVFANACNNSALDVDSLSESMSVAAPIFNAAGYSIEDAALYMGVMANAGIPASEAANSLKTGLSRLISPAKDGAEWMEKLGIEVTNADGSMKDSVTIQEELHDAFSGLSESEQIAAASAIFGKNQMSKWLALINTAPEDVDSLATSLEKEGTTAEMAESMMSGFGGSLEKLKSNVDVAKTSLGEALAPTISKVAEKIQQLVEWFNNLDEGQQQTIAKIALVVAAIGPVLIILGTLISSVGSIVSVIGTAVGAMGGLSGAMTLLSGPVGIVIAVIAGLIAVGVLLYQNWDTICEYATKLKEWVTQKWEELKTSVTEAVTNLKTAITEKWDAIKTAVSNKIESIKSAVSTKWTAIKDTVSNKLEEMKTSASEKWEAVKSAASTVLDAMQTTAETKWENIKSAYEKAGGGIEGVVAATMTTIKEKWTAGFDLINKLTGGKLDGLKSKIDNAFNSAVDIVTRAVSTLKNLVNFEWSLPHIKLPHFSISGTFSLNPPSVPHLSVSWYRKAYDNPIMFTQPTVIPTANGYKGFGDGHGAEVVLGMDKLRELAGGTVINNITVNPAPGMDETTLAERVADAIQFRVDAEGAVWA